ncbi:MAG: esterase [Planctomycetota bacterium]
MSIALAKPLPQTLEVQGETREYLLEKPSLASDQLPVVFVYHGHGGKARSMATKGFAECWPEAMFIYPQGLPTATGRDPEGKRSGWQNRSGIQSDRDLALFDAILAKVKKEHEIDVNRIFATGHSNGGGMTGLLWATRRDALAAVAISAGGIGEPWKLKPLPVMHLIGNQDPIVKPSNQRRNIGIYKLINQSQKDSLTVEGVGEKFESPIGCDVVVFEHSGGHKFLDDAPQRITGFFKTQSRPEEGYPEGSKESLKEIESPWQTQFNNLDSNNDGKVSADELQRPILLRRLDRNQDGFITPEELPSN